MRPGPGLRPLLRVLLVAVLLGVATVAAWRLQASRDREEEARLREIHTLTGTVERHSDFRSTALAATRRVWVYLPPQYAAEPARRFPVLYMQDGQNVFDGATAFLAGKEWEVDETVERLAGEGRIEPLVVVAVDNGGERRLVEYTPTHDRRAPDGGGADGYGRMLVEELKPWVDRTYRTRPEREATGIGGSSLGGLVSLYLGLKHPEVFGRIAALSTSAWWDDRFIVSFVAALPDRPETRIWTDTGTREGGRAVPDARALRDALVRKGWREGVDLRYVEADGAAHNEVAWAKRMPAVLEFLFPPGATKAPVRLPSSAPGRGALPVTRSEFRFENRRRDRPDESAFHDPPLARDAGSDLFRDRRRDEQSSAAHSSSVMSM